MNKKKITPSPEAQHLIDEYKNKIAMRKWEKKNLVCFHERFNKYPTYFII